ncbi:MAG TPA: hypothetical protein DEB40_03480 [Elusimicrobia bacterium]|nr:hypothetical protein [Elusimicrobiota bacterium]HBT60790.1 hypothetical protein [Elusimicrobiota bacterium]
MAKKNRSQKRQSFEAGNASAAVEGITPLGKKVISAGVAIIVLGFIVLSRADAMGRNWAADLSPFLILGGYAVVAIGIFVPEKLPTFSQSLPPPSGLAAGPDGVSGPEKTI